MDALKDLKWPAAIVIVAALGAVVWLVQMGQDLTAVGLVIAGLLGVQVHKTVQQGRTVDEVKTLANGNLAAERAQREALQAEMQQQTADYMRTIAQLTAQLPPGSPLPTSLTDEPEQLNSGPLTRRLPPRP